MLIGVGSLSINLVSSYSQMLVHILVALDLILFLSRVDLVFLFVFDEGTIVSRFLIAVIFLSFFMLAFLSFYC
jgi:hypothetical protein